MNARTTLDQKTIKEILCIPTAVLDQTMAAAYQLYRRGQYRDVETLCQGLIACDHNYWWSYSLLAAALRKLGRLDEALDQLDLGLKYEPEQPKLLLMRGEILAAQGRPSEAAAHLAPVLVTGRPVDQVSASRKLAQMEVR